MKLGFIGLGKMGKNMVLHLLEQGIDVFAYNRTQQATDQLKAENPKLTVAYTTQDFVKLLPSPRVIWLMVAAGAPVDEVIDSLIASGIQKDDIVIDGGNSFYKDSIRRNDKLSKSSIKYIDCGTSGGLEGGRNGACLMLGGEESVIERLRWLWDALAIKDGWNHFGPAGAGHFVKMVHNAVEYGIDQALGEGFEMLAKSPYELDLVRVANTWNHGSVVRSWLIELLGRALTKDPHLDTFTGKVGGGETGVWALATAKELGVDAKILEDAISARKTSLTTPTFVTKVVSALRKEYGGHEEKTG